MRSGFLVSLATLSLTPLGVADPVALTEFVACNLEREPFL
jgi:hypothetical protein